MSIYLSYAAGISLIGFAAMLGFFYFSMHLYTAQYRALLPDTIESGKRGKASGVITLFEWGGNLFLFVIAGIFIAMAVAETGEKNSIMALSETPYLQIPYIITALFLVVAALFVYFVVREPKVSGEVESEGLGKYIKSIFANRDFLKFYTAQTLWWMSFEVISVFLVGIIAFIIYGSASEKNVEAVTSMSLFMMALFNIAVLIGSLPGGIVYDKIGRRLSIITGGLIFALPQLWGFFVNDYLEIGIALGIAGIGWGILMASSFPVVGDLLTKYKKELLSGRYYGVFEATRSLPLILAAIGGGALVEMVGRNYRVLFPIGAILVFLAMPLIWSMKKLEVGSK